MDKLKKMKIVFMGTPTFACESLRVLAQKFDVVAVVTSPDQPAGRGLQIQKSAVKMVAEDWGIPVLAPFDLKDPVFLETLKNLNADLFVVVAFKMLPKIIFEMPRLGTINLHASLLPQYRGAAPINWVLIHGEQQTGLTTFFIEEKMDTGKIIDQVILPILNEDNAGTLHDKMMVLGGSLLMQTLEKIALGVVEALPQNELLTDQPLKKAPKIFKKDCLICFDQPAAAVFNFIRGLSPYPTAFLVYQEKGKTKTMKVFEVEISDKIVPVGEVFIDEKRKNWYIGCLDKAVKILEIQVEGRRKCKSDEFLRGCQVFSIKKH